MRKRTSKKLIAGIIILVIGIFAAGWFLFAGRTLQAEKKEEVKVPKDIPVSVVCVGDIMVHTPQLSAHYDVAEDSYSFDNNYKYVKPYIQEADLAMCNVETTFAGGSYSGYPMFNSPDSLADALKNTGFDVAFTANNHMADTGLSGIKRTPKVLNKKGIAATGSVENPEDPRYVIQDVKGVSVGIVAFTYETGSGAGSTSINGAVISSEAADRINSFNFNTMEEDQEKIKSAIDSARGAGAEVIIVYYHWGEEYQQQANEHQKELAQKTAEMGADIIFASHPHVLQQTDYIQIEETGKEVPVFYSMGNFISNQRAETLNNKFTEQGVIAQVNFTYSKAKKEIKEISMSGMPTWLDRYYAGGRFVYRIVPLDEDLEQNDALASSGHLSRAKQALEDTDEILELNQ